MVIKYRKIWGSAVVLASLIRDCLISTDPPPNLFCQPPRLSSGANLFLIITESCLEGTSANADDRDLTCLGVIVILNYSVLLHLPLTVMTITCHVCFS